MQKEKFTCIFQNLFDLWGEKKDKSLFSYTVLAYCGDALIIKSKRTETYIYIYSKC